MKLKKNYKILVSKWLLVVFFLPILFFVLHDLSDHQHEICTSKYQKHIHSKDVDCTLHLLKQGNTYLETQNFQVLFDFFESKPDHLKYSFFLNHQHLSFSLRAPPSLL